MILPINFYNKTAYIPLKNTFLGFSGLKPSSKNTPEANLRLKTQLNQDVFEFEKRKEGAPVKKGQIVMGDNIFCRQSTYLFRRDLDWKKLGYYIQKRFKGEDKVNTYCYACSKGDEAYSLSITLQQLLGDEAEKFFPIFAKDINENTIERNIFRQKNGRKTIPGYLSAKFALGLKQEEIEKFIKPLGLIQCGELESVLTQKTTGPVKFECANILEDIDSIDTKHPSIILARNMWPYVNKNEYESFTKRLYEKLPKGSVVIIGEYDYRGEKGMIGSNSFPNYLIEAGFELSKDYEHLLRRETGLVFERN